MSRDIAGAGNPPGRSPVLEAALDALSGYGPAVLALMLFVGALGVPVPGAMLLLAAGASVQAGLLNAWLALFPAYAAAVTGDGGSYLIGRYGGRKAFGWLERRLSWRRAERAFERWGAWAIVLTRFLVTPLALPTNLMAGGGRYSFHRFLLLSALGNLVWVVSFVSLGYLFAGSWKAIGAFAGDLSGGLVVGAILVGIGLYEVYAKCRCHVALAPDPADAGDPRRNRSA